MKQRCTLLNVWLSWLALPVLVAVAWYVRGWPAAAAVAVAAVVAELLYLRFFPVLSRWLGYGSVEDEAAAPERGADAPAEVVLYTANLCPFCPIVRRRLATLRESLGFQLREVDVTFQPALVRAKGLRSVPVVEAGGRLLHGNATSAALASFLSGDGQGPAD